LRILNPVAFLKKKEIKKNEKPNSSPLPPMIFKMPPIRDNFGSLGLGMKPEEEATILVGGRPKKDMMTFKTKRQMKEDDEKNVLIKLKIRCNLDKIREK
jgi:hypothetical protein